MMRTDHDLHGAFALLEQRADDYCAPDIAVAQPQRHRVRDHGRQWRIRTALATAVTAAVVAGGVYAVTTFATHHSTAPGTPPSGPPPQPVTLQYEFKVSPLPGVQVRPQGVNRSFQYADVVWNSGRDGEAELRVYTSQAFDPTGVIAHGSKVKVGAHDGYFDATPRDPDNQHDPMPMLAWQYAPDSWTTIQFNATTRDIDTLRQAALTLADAVRTRAPNALRLPFRLGYVPPNTVPETAGANPPGSFFSGSIGLSDGVPASDPDPTIAALRVEVLQKPTAKQTFCANGTARVPVQGTKGCFRALDDGRAGREFGFETPDVWVAVTIDHAHLAVYSDDVLVKIAQSVRFAPSLHDYGTWFDARTVLPH